ncbi:MAG: hypothetical protein K8I27_15355 [Planctomycetes bacterium]|nr:hypothetical protein [Planctomycetota bacterium]
MYKWFVIAFVAVSFAFGAPMAAQGAGQGGKGNWGKNAGRNGGGQGADDWRKRAEEEIGWGEDGTEERIEPGQEVEDDAKEARLKEEAAKLKLEDEKVIKDFIKYGKKAWEKAEKEDKRWATAYKKAKSDEERLAKETAEHKEKLAEAWADGDEDMLKKEILNEEQVKQYAENTKDLREESATDKSIRQDEIRARKMEEWKEQAKKWAGGNKGAAGNGDDNEAKKEKKDDEGEEEEKKED